MRSPRIPQDDPPKQLLDPAVMMHLVGAVQFGKVIITYEHGRPVYVERIEGYKLEGAHPKAV